MKFFNRSIPRMAHASLGIYEIFRSESTETRTQFPLNASSPIKLLPDRVALFLPGVRALLQPRVPECHFTAYQCFALNSACFFSLFPSSNYKNLNFDQLWNASVPHSRRYDSQAEKIKCLVEYFNQISDYCDVLTDISSSSTEQSNAEEQLTRVVSFMLCPYYNSNQKQTFLRLNAESWMSQSDKKMASFTFKPIYDSTNAKDASLIYSDHLEADFANKHIGGGVLRTGLVQEEIRFITAPELLVSRLVCPTLKDVESCLMVGAKTICNHSGYGGSFCFEGKADADLSDKGFHFVKNATYSYKKVIKDESEKVKRLNVYVLGIDAEHYPPKGAARVQFQPERIIRELNKIYYSLVNIDPKAIGLKQRKFATGNWGCGAFNGDFELKAMIQWIAASAAGWEVDYYPWNKNASMDVQEMTNKIRQNHLNVADLSSALFDAAFLESLESTGSEKSTFNIMANLCE
eukprot:GDKJ01018730.1.p1 GENE.GDKJ01018730.1~~GDKJ01018730.1.p1  ORF type:complete len:536 (+),score=93.58 GDKJ01018730.1:223-1608(+)